MKGFGLSKKIRPRMQRIKSLLNGMICIFVLFGIFVAIIKDFKPPSFLISNEKRIYTKPTSVYDREWYENGFLTEQDYIIPSNGGCTPCKFNVRNFNPNSNKRDIIVTATFWKTTNAFPCVRSLRTTGCKATFFIFTDPVARSKMTEQIIRSLEKCGCHVVLAGVSQVKTKQAYQVFRYSAYYDFILNRKQFIDRILAIDIADTVFQGDPFSDAFNVSAINICLESGLFTDDPKNLNMNWIKNISKRNYENYYGKQIVNAGVFWGGIQCFLTYCKVLFSLYDPMQLSSIVADDQGYVNYIFRSGILVNSSFDLPFNLVPLYGPIVYMSAEADSTTIFKLGEFKRPQSVIHPLVIHQFDRSINFCKSVYNACPKESGLKMNEPYMRCRYLSYPSYVAEISYLYQKIFWKQT